MGKKLQAFKNILNLTIIAILGVVGIVFSVLFIDTFISGFIFEYAKALKIVSVVLITLIAVAAIVFFELKVEIVYKFCYIAVVLVTLALIMLYILSVTGVLATIESVDDLRAYIEGMGPFMPIVFIVLQFLQVVVLPIPAVVSISAGVLLFGALKAAIYSFIGILCGSILAFFIGKYLGYKVAAWLVGKDNLDKVLKAVKGKDKAVLTFMFLFPFFPDDILCFVSGLSSMSTAFFIVMIVITRFISIFISCFAYDGALIPYDTWWGLLLWGVFIAVTVVLTIVIYKKGDKIEAFFKDKFSKKKKNCKNDNKSN